MLKHAEPKMVLGGFGMFHEHPLKSTDTIVFRRVVPYNAGTNGVSSITATDFLLQEGSTPDAATIDYEDVSVTLKHYGHLFKLSSDAALMYEDDIPTHMLKQTGEILGQVAEMVDYGEFKAGITVHYSNGSTRAGINTTISLPKLQAIARTLENNQAQKVTSAIMPGLKFDTSAVEECFLCFVSTDAVSDIRALPGFTPRVKYGSAITPAHVREFGACEDFRFISSSLLAPFLAAGSASLNGMKATDSTNVDVYPMLVIGEEAWGHVSLKGHGKTSISPTYLPPNVKSIANPLGQFGYVGGDFRYASVRLNENWFVRFEHAVTDLDA